MRGAGELPPDLVLKTSVLLPCTNGATARALQELGATTINVSTDLSVETLAEIRAACTAPLDVYVEAPDDQGGFVRHYEVPELIRRRGAALRQARAPQRAEHLPIRPPPRGRRRQARTRAGPPGGARAAARRRARAGTPRRTRRRCSPRPRDPRMSSLELDRFDALTFDCFGTLIDWERGLLDALRPCSPRGGSSSPTTSCSSATHDTRRRCEAGPYLRYREVVAGSLDGSPRSSVIESGRRGCRIRRRGRRLARVPGLRRRRCAICRSASVSA